MQRILTNGNTPSQETRIALLSRLATTSPPSDGIGDEILQHMLKAYHTDQGHELAVTWLFSLYKQQTGADKGDGKGAGDGPSQGGSETGPSVKAEANAAAGAAAASHVTKAGGQVKKEEGEQGATAMEVDGLGGDHRPYSCVQLRPNVVFSRHGTSKLASCVVGSSIALQLVATMLSCGT